MGISAIFIRRPIATSLLMLGVLIFGASTYSLLPVASLPTVDFPTISVQASLPGASPDTMASSVATPLEQQFSAIPGLDSMTSTSGLGGTTITLQFKLDRNIDGAAQDVQTAINAASGLLPKDLPNPPTYYKVNPADRPVLIYAVHSDLMPIYQLDEYAYTVLAQKLSTISGVGQVSIAGQQTYAPHIQINPVALAARGLGLEDVRNALTNATLDLAKGNLEGEHQTLPIDTNDQLFKAGPYGDLIIAYRNGAPVRIKDVGQVVDSTKAPRTAAWVNGQPGELLFVTRQAGANTLEVVQNVKAMMTTLRASVPDRIQIDLISDGSLTIRASVRDVEATLLLTVGLVVLVIFAFLRTLWATVIPSVTVPLALVATFGMMYVLGYSLDNLSLMGLTIAVGFVVDDAIVMIENIVRYIEEGERPIDAALRGSGEIGFTIISITFSLIAVFIPLLFMGGIIGRLFHEFAVTVSVAVVASAAVALTLTPVMCALFLKRDHGGPKSRLNRAFESFFDGMLRTYDRGLRWAFAHQPLMLGITLGLIVVSATLYIWIPKGFFPEQDVGFLFGQAEVRQDSSFFALRKTESQVSDILRADPDVAAVAAFGGANASNPFENVVRMFIQLKPFEERTSSAKQVIQRLRPKVAKVEGAFVFLQPAQDIMVGGKPTKTLYQFSLTDTDTNELYHWAPILQAELAKLKPLQDVTSDQQIASPHLGVVVDRDAAYRMGLSLSLIDETLYDAFGQRQVTTIYTSTNQYKVILEVQPEFQSDQSALERIFVPGPSGGQVPLSAVAHFTSSVQPLTVNHQGQFPAVTLSFNLTPGYSIGQAVDAVNAALVTLHTPPALQGAFQGTAQAFRASLSSTPLLVAAAILVVYIVLGMLYESYIHPLTILSALPSAGVGALIMLMLCGLDLSVIAIIGIILLIGIVKKNAIMMIDFALEAERNEGKSPLEAIHQACLLRFRPIMMTTMAALFGGLPLALGSGAGSELRQPLGVAIVGGLLVSQALTLYTTPIVYLYLDRLAARFGRRGRTRSAPALPTPAPGGTAAE